MIIKMTLSEFIAMLNKLYISYVVDRVNDKIVHIKLIKGNDIFRLRFVDNGCSYDANCFEFTNFFEG